MIFSYLILYQILNTGKKYLKISKIKLNILQNKNIRIRNNIKILIIL